MPPPPPHTSQPPAPRPTVTQLTSSLSGASVLYVRLEDCRLGPTVLQLALSGLPSLQTLVLRRCGLGSLDALSLPVAVRCDLSGNVVRDLESVVRFSRRAPNSTWPRRLVG